MNTTMIILRLIHLFSAVIWMGGSFVMVGFVGPAARAVGQDAQKFMQQLTVRSRFSVVMTILAVLTVLSGLSMYWLLFHGIVVSTGAGLALTVGGGAGIYALGAGYFSQGRSIARMKVISMEIAKSGGAPKPEQAAEMQALQEKMRRGGLEMVTAMVVALIGMTLSEYFAL